MDKKSRWVAAALVAVALAQHASSAGPAPDGWSAYGHDTGATRYSPLADITPTNVARLGVAWTYHTGDISDGKNRTQRSGLETTPIVVDGTMFLTTGKNRIIALDPETGRERWVYDPRIDLAPSYGDGLINRGVATWLDPSARAGQPCRRRIYEATLDARLVAVDAASGQPCGSFGAGGAVSLANVARYRAGAYHMTSPPAVIDALVVVGSGIDDNDRVDMPSGAVRAFDARSGALKWQWEPIPLDADGAASSTHAWQTGAANAWSVLSVDPERHLVFVPTGSASPDYFGGLRPGDDKWANSVVALRAKDGTLAWGFQLVHHDLWDYDSPAAPLLATLRRGGRPVPVVVQGNKAGFFYVLNRDTGAPVFSITERAAPKSDVPGEAAFATQPIPDLPAVTPQRTSAADAWGPTPADRDACRAVMQNLRNDGLFTPPSIQGSLAYPGNLGGINWSGYAFDQVRSLLVVNTNNLPAEVRLIPRAEFDGPNRTREDGEYGRQAGSPYGMFRRFLRSPSGLPCTAPPWGVLTAVDLETGTIRWQVPIGSIQELVGDRGPAPPGSLSLGGPIVTAGGLIFQAGTMDRSIYALDVETGNTLWKGDLPASGHATPITYKVRATGRQYVVIAAGGHAKVTEERQDDAIVAFALPTAAK